MDVRLMRYPDVYGEKIVFTYASDLWTVGLEGGVATRLTSHPGLEYRAKFSPDGKWIAFSGQYDGDTDVYVVPSTGGEPKRLTYSPGNDMVGDWTPDGKIAFLSAREMVRPAGGMLWKISPNGGMPERTDVHEAYDVSFSTDGNTLAYNRVSSHTFNWRRYRGGTQGKVSFFDFRSKKYWEMPSGREQNYFPMWAGDSVYYVSDLNQGTLNLYKYDPKAKKKSQLTKFDDADVRWPSTDGKTIAFERNGRVYAYSIDGGAIKEVKAKVASDQLQRRPYYRNVAAYANWGAISPSGKRLVVAARGDVYSVPAENGETRNLTETQGAREEMPTWSPDGQEIAFISDKDGEARLYTMPQMGGEWKLIKTPEGASIASFDYSPDSKKMLVRNDDYENFVIDLATGETKLVFRDPQSATPTDWSADGKWIAYIKTGNNLFGSVYLYDVEKGESHKVTEGYYNDSSVAFDLNGKFLYVASSRTFNFAPSDFEIDLHQNDTQRVYVLPLKADMRNPMEKAEDEEPVKPKEDKPAEEKKPEEKKPDVPTIDLEGLDQRAIALDVPPGSYPFLIGAKDGVFTMQGGALVKIDVATGKPTTIFSGFGNLSFNPDRTKFAYQAGPIWGISAVKPGVTPGTGRVDMGGVTMTIDPLKEWTQMMRDAWRYERDNFYDKGMLGLDWTAIGDKYVGMVASAGDRSDITYIMGMMIGELGTGHAYVQGGDFGPGTGNPGGGMLGADYAVRGDRVVLKKVYKGLNFESARRGPLGAPGVDVKDGDVLLEIDGKSVDASVDVHALLIGKANKDVKIKVSSNGGEPRTYKVTPVSNEQQLRYIEWVEGNRKKVEEMSGGRIGYVHVPNTAVQGITEFIKGYYAQSDKEAFVIDERYNGGGFIPTFFGERLMRPIVTGIQQRHGTDMMYPPQTWDGPKAMLINRYAGSGGDHFPWLFRHLKIGPLFGTRTWGGLVGISGGRLLVDFGQVTAPEFALYDIETGQVIAENKGIDPDVEVDDTPDLVSQGRDPELEAAIKYLMDELKKGRKPYAKPKFLTNGG